MWQTNLMEQRS